MRVLMLHNRYLLRGGEDESTDAEVALLRQHGHDVDLLEWDNQTVQDAGRARTAVGAMWSHATYRELRRRLEREQYDVAHVQNFFPLISPAAHHAIHRAGVPLVQALRNYRLLCINGLFHRDRQRCEACTGKLGLLPGIVRRCYRGSLPGSLSVSGMLSLHRALRTWRTTVDVFYTLSDFARQKFVEGGVAEQKVVVKPNFVAPDPGPSSSERSFALFVGRLSPEKGVATLLRAWRRLGDVPLRVVGDGPLADVVRREASTSPAIEWLGKRDVSDVLRLMGSAKFVIFPSEWYETFGRVSIEAFSRGTPALVSALGAMQEIVEDGHTGLHFRAGDEGDLADKVRWAWEHPVETSAMGRNARVEFEKHYCAEANHQMLMGIYERAISGRRERGEGMRSVAALRPGA